ncbi:uncharacterized protein LOC131882930 isoform X2 [Tigriopus californicus]|uniref:uncharacterized protein LOC131882930 isoform X2 n=1 Tax=Tigriopus californicus TaxID=6832 RepID=UPI0027DA3EA7|nr:uncharacterized protein LOC131882930 isoform X2 [Tigriopus californicus]
MFSTLQRPTLEELERRRAMRETFSPPRSSTLHRRESMISRGFNAIFRRDSMMVRNKAEMGPGPRGLNLRTATGGPPITNNNNNLANKRLSRAMSFKYPERISHIPPPEVTRLRSKSQHSINEYSSGGSGSGSNSGGYVDMITDSEPIYGFRSPPPPIGGWVPREKFMVQRRQSYMPPTLNRGRPREISNPGSRKRQPLPPEFFYSGRSDQLDPWMDFQQEDESYFEEDDHHHHHHDLYTDNSESSPPSGTLQRPTVLSQSNTAISSSNVTLASTNNPPSNGGVLSSGNTAIVGGGGGGGGGPGGTGSSRRPSPPVVAMVSRRKILSRSRDDLHMDNAAFQYREEDDVWYQKEKLYKDHILEVLNKWESIDDEIWAKVIVLERNRRVAKAYARAPVLTVNGSNDGFDGFRIGVNGFENPMRDPKTEEFKAQIGQGCKIKMDETGNILIKRFSKHSIFVKNTIEENAVSNDILKLPNGLLDLEKPFKLFDMKKFQQNVNREMKRNYPDRRKLECQCISTIAFSKNEPELLDSPIWIMLINVVALEMLKAKMPMPSLPISSSQVSFSASSSASPTRPNGRHSSEPRKRFVASGSSDEDPYSLTPSGSSGSSGKGNNSGRENGGNSNGSSGENIPRLPPRDKEYFGPQNWSKAQLRPDYSDDMDEENHTLTKSKSRIRPSRKSEEKRKHHESGDDPYYCGLRARVPNFGNGPTGTTKKEGKKERNSSKNAVRSPPPPSRSVPNLQNIAQLPGTAHPFWWHSRLYPEAPGMGVQASGKMTKSCKEKF